MRVLVLENEPGASTPVVDHLRRAGHEVARCHDTAGPAFPCNGLKADRACPLDGPTVSAAVVSGHGESPDDDLAAHEQGVRCALRAYVPVIVVGDRARSSLLPFASGFAVGPESVVTAVNESESAHLHDHERVASAMFRRVLDAHDLADVRADTDVRRSPRGVQVVLRPSAEIPSEVAAIAGVRVTGAIRTIDACSAGVSVAVEPR